MDQRTQNMIWRISDEKMLQLIDLYEKEESLWNTTAAEFRNKWRKKEATERIAKALNIKHFTYRHVALKLKNIRNTYRQVLKKIANSINSGEDPIYSPKVYWFSKLDGFLRPHVLATSCTIPVSMNASTLSITDKLNFINFYFIKHSERQEEIRREEGEKIVN